MEYLKFEQPNIDLDYAIAIKLGLNPQKYEGNVLVHNSKESIAKVEVFFPHEKVEDHFIYMPTQMWAHCGSIQHLNHIKVEYRGNFVWEAVYKECHVATANDPRIAICKAFLMG